MDDETVGGRPASGGVDTTPDTAPAPVEPRTDIREEELTMACEQMAAAMASAYALVVKTAIDTHRYPAAVASDCAVTALFQVLEAAIKSELTPDDIPDRVEAHAAAARSRTAAQNNLQVLYHEISNFGDRPQIIVPPRRFQ